MNKINGVAACALREQSNQMGLVVIIVAAFTILGVAALGLVLAQKGATPTATAASTVYIASVTQEISALFARAPVTQIAQATGSEASPLILQANVDAQSGSPMTAVTQAPSAAAASPNLKDRSPSTISKAMVHETARLKDDANSFTGSRTGSRGAMFGAVAKLQLIEQGLSLLRERVEALGEPAVDRSEKLARACP